MSVIYSYIAKFISLTREAFGESRSSHNLLKNDETYFRRTRYVKAVRTTFVSAGNTILSGMISFISIALTIRYLGIERYGIWLTIFTIFSWLSLSDFGIGNALTNKLAESLGSDQTNRAQYLVLSAFWSLVPIGICIAFIGVWLGFSFPWPYFLHTHTLEANRELPIAISLAFGIYGIGFPLNIARNIYNGYQEGYYANIWNIVMNIFSLVALIIATKFKGGLPLLVIAVFGVQLIVQLANAFYLFGFHRRHLIPYIHLLRKADIISLFKIGIMFVVLQLVATINLQSDNMIIINVMGPGAVALFGTTWKLICYTRVVQSLILNPLWPAYGEAYARGDCL